MLDKLDKPALDDNQLITYYKLDHIKTITDPDERAVAISSAANTVVQIS